MPDPADSPASVAPRFAVARLAVIGVGLIGGSLARALRETGAVSEIVGCGRDAGNLQRALALGVIDRHTHDPAVAVAGADLVVVATTLGATAGVLERMAPALGAGTIVTDVGSAKCEVAEAARRTLGPHLARFVPGHPIAGAERSGVEASVASLFARHRVILTPLAETEAEALVRVRAMWEATGALVSEMEPDHHDEILAATSHLPHMLAYALVDCLAGMSSAGEIFDYAAGGFRDFTRIASSSPEMWRDIALDNRRAVLAMCGRFEQTFGELRRALEAADGAALHALFTRAKAARDDFVQRLATR